MPSSVKSFDFIESDCNDCFEIWGIQLKGKKLPKVQLPKEIVNQQLDFNAPLPTTEIKSGKAIISGRLFQNNHLFITLRLFDIIPLPLCRRHIV